MRYIPATHSTDLTALIADFSGESADQCASRGDLGCGWVGGGFCNGGRQTIDFKPPPHPLTPSLTSFLPRLQLILEYIWP